MVIQEGQEGGNSLPLSVSSVAVAVNATRNSKYAVQWALENFACGGEVIFRILHVRPKITAIPTPMGNYLPISQVRDDIASAYKKEIEWQTEKKLVPFKRMCAERQVKVEALVIEADDVAEAILKEVKEYMISKLIVGASSRKIFKRNRKGSNLASKISKCIPRFCTVYVVSSGKLSSVHASMFETDETASTSGTDKSIDSSCASCSISSNIRTKSDLTNTAAKANFSLPGGPLQPVTQNKAFFPRDHRRISSADTFRTTNTSLCEDDDGMTCSSNMSEMQFSDSLIFSQSSQAINESWRSAQGLTLDNPRKSSLSRNEVDIDFELEKLRIELRHLKGITELAQDESVSASQQINELSARHMEEAVRLKETRLREEKAKEMAQREKEEREEAKKEAEYLRQCAEREAWLRKDVENVSAREASEKQRLEKALASNDEQYKKFTWEEIESATSSFHEMLKIGIGANGTVYKGSFHHLTAAVKVLHSFETHITKQFNQELDVLSRIRHPHLLLLVGACPERGCLVYEYMENGSLDDRLRCKDNTPPLPWFYRYRIAWEVASALVFLHNHKPEPIIHRDLKPANILLNNNFVSKIGDVGLSTLVPTENLLMSTMYKDTSPVGTFFYIDPEYQRTGLVSPKSDTYALGMVILQLLTAKPPLGLAHIVETALEDGRLVDILDSQAGQWPKEETQELAVIGLSCLELRRKDRPDLEGQVLPVLERLKDMGDEAYSLAQNASPLPPSHFICPILKKVMDDPCIAADGYTYDHDAIEKWLSINNKSPITNLPLPNKHLIRNQSLLSAIKEWKFRSQMASALL